MSGLVNRDMIKVMSMTDSLDSALESAASTLDVCSSGSDLLQLCLRPSVTLAQSSVGFACRRGKVACRVLQLQGYRRRFWNFLDYDRVY